MTPPTRFEDLPNELLFDIFDILHTHQLYTTLTGLNRRFDQLVADCGANVHIRGESGRLDFMINCGIVRPNKIRTLQITDALHNNSMMQRFHDILTSTHGPLSSLRSLKCLRTATTDINEVLNQIPDFNRLENIYLDGEMLPDNDQLISLLTSRSLKTCHLSTCLILLHELTPSLQLERLTLNWCYWSELVPFIARSVTWLRASVFDFDFPIQQQTTKLKYLHLILADSFPPILDRLQKLFEICPDLRYLSLEIPTTNYPPLVLFDAGAVCAVLRKMLLSSCLRRVKFCIQFSTSDEIDSIDVPSLSARWMQQGLFRDVKISVGAKLVVWLTALTMNGDEL